MKMTKTLAEISNGELFKVAGIEFIKFADENGQNTAIEALKLEIVKG